MASCAHEGAATAQHEFVMTPAGAPALAQPQPADIEIEFARALADSNTKKNAPARGSALPGLGRIIQCINYTTMT